MSLSPFGLTRVCLDVVVYSSGHESVDAAVTRSTSVLYLRDSFIIAGRTPIALFHLLFQLARCSSINPLWERYLRWMSKTRRLVRSPPLPILRLSFVPGTTVQY